jgi:hypothetical protein
MTCSIEAQNYPRPFLMRSRKKIEIRIRKEEEKALRNAIADFGEKESLSR